MSKIETTSKVSLKLISRIKFGRWDAYEPSPRLWTQPTSPQTLRWQMPHHNTLQYHGDTTAGGIPIPAKWKPETSSRHQKRPMKKDTPRNFAKFIGKHLCQSLPPPPNKADPLYRTCTAAAPEERDPQNQICGLTKTTPHKCFLRIWSDLLKKPLVENFIFCSVWIINNSFSDMFSLAY